jgi:hypothetical protein
MSSRTTGRFESVSSQLDGVLGVAVSPSKADGEAVRPVQIVRAAKTLLKNR